MKPRNVSNRPKPIICKFIRRLAREEVISRRTEVSQVAPQDVDLPETSSLTNAIIVDHLTPKTQELFNAAKSFKAQHDFRFCWVKNGTVYLRRSEGSSCIKIKDFDDLQLLVQENLE